MIVIRDSAAGYQFFAEKMGARKSDDFRSTLYVSDKHRRKVMQMDAVGVGIAYEGFFGKVCNLHIIIQDKHVFSRRVIHDIFARPFWDWFREAVIAPVSSANEASIELCRRVGFTVLASIKDGAVDGDLIFFQLRRADCRWLRSN